MYPQNLLQDLIKLAFPQLCPACSARLRAPGLITCLNCFHQLPFFSNHNLYDNEIMDRMAGRVPVFSSFALLYFIKTGLSQQIIHNIKYKGDKWPAMELGKLLGTQLVSSGSPLPDWDLICPVPLHPGKLKLRGYNQSAVFAKGLSESLQIPMVPDILRRTRKGESQASQGREDRLTSIFRAFTANRKEEIKDRHILLADDVLTTGATLESCSNILLQHGAKKVSLGLIAVAVQY